MIATAATHGLHVHHPEVVGISTDDMNGLAKAKFDLESVAVKLQHLQWFEAKVGTQQEYRPAHRVVDDHKAHNVSDRSPPQIQDPPAYDDISSRHRLDLGRR